MKRFIYLLGIILLSMNPSFAADFYFSTTGVDSNPGTSVSPKQTLSAAQALITTGNNVFFKAGETWFGSLTIQGSGTSGTRVTVGRYGTGANPIITGLTVVSSWTSLGNNIWESVNPVSTVTTLRCVVINGTLTQPGRYPDPNSTAMSPQSNIHPVPGNDGWLNYEGKGAYFVTDNQLSGTPSWTGAEIVLRTYNWVLDRGTITNHSGTRLDYSPNTQDGGFFSPPVYNGMAYFIQNDAKTLTYQGAWYYNPSTKRLRVYSTTIPTDVKVATVNNLISSNNKNYISFNGVDLIGSNADLVYMNSSATGWNFTDCKIEFSGRDGVYCANGANNCNFLRTTVKDCGSNGIMFRENANNNNFTNNIILRAGIFPGLLDQTQYYSGEGLCSIGNNNTITGNHVSFAGMNGIRFGGDNALINKNFVSDYCYTKSDGGAIYTWGIDGNQNWANQIIEDNICLNGSMKGSIGNWLEAEEVAVKGIYLDATSKNFIIQRNTVANTVGAGIYLNNPLNTVVRYNTTYNARYAGLHLNRYAGQGTMNFRATGNILVAKKLGSPLIQGNNPPTQSNQRTFYYKSDADDIASSITTLDSNVYARPLDDFTSTGSQSTPTMSQIKSISKVQYNGSFTGPGEYGTQTTYSLASFKTAFPSWNQTSWMSPVGITDTSKLFFYYNWSDSNLVVNLVGTFKDMKNVTYNNSITLLPYASVVLIQTASAPVTATYYISTTGNDGAAGSIGAPWRNLSKLNSVTLNPGDIVYLRGGTYNTTQSAAASTHVLLQNKNGSSINRIKIWNYPGEQAILDLSTFTPTHANPNGLYLENCSWLHIKGLRITGLKKNVSGISRAFEVNGGGNNIFEQMEIDNIGGYGFRNVNSNDNLYLNCDAHHMGDGPDWGGSNGFESTGADNTSTRITFDGCRAWLISDDGFDIFRQNGIFTFKNCWAFWNGYKPWTNGAINPGTSGSIPTIGNPSGFQLAGDGDGFKLGPTAEWGVNGASSLVANMFTRTVSNCLGFENRKSGFDQNAANTRMGLYNNTAYKNGEYGFHFGYSSGMTHIFRNNAAAENITGIQWQYNGIGTNVSHNTWNGGVTINNSTFQNGVSTGMDGTRQSDGSLPNLNYLKLANSSNLIDAGTNVGTPFCGAAPDMGALESCEIFAPTVNIGEDKTIVLPANQVSFNPTITGTTVSFLWQRLTGNSSAVITNTTTAATVINFTQTGVYTFQLRVMGPSAQAVYDTVQVTVSSVTLPTVTANADINITLPVTSVTLTSTESAGSGSIISRTWAKTAGGYADILTPTSPNTVVNIFVAGTYEFIITLVTTAGTVKDTVILTVNPEIIRDIRTIVATVNASVTKSRINLSWVSEATNNTVSYSIERKFGSGSFQTIFSKSPSLTNSLYTHVDRNLNRGTYTYRILVVDKNGSSYSSSVSITR